MNEHKMLHPLTEIEIVAFSELNVGFDPGTGKEYEYVTVVRVENPFGDILSTEEVSLEAIEILEEELTWRHNQPLDPTEDQ